MKEMLKSKTVIGFIVFILGITYINSIQIHMIENASSKQNDQSIMMDAK